MDLLTQAALGSAVGYVVVGKKLGKKAFLIGAGAGLLPDMDILPTLAIDDNFLYLKHHRGLSHSLVFTLLVPAALMLAKKRVLANVFFWAIGTHILLDCFTSWGTQVFWPVVQRVAWNTIFIVDPGYTLPLLVGVIGGSIVKSDRLSQQWVLMGLLISSLYLGAALGAKAIVGQKFTALMRQHNITAERIMTRPSPFNIILWSSTIETADSYQYAMISLLDRKLPEQLFVIAKNKDIPARFDVPQVRELVGYTNGFFTTETQQNTLVIHDLRYGFMGDPFLNGENYVFSYHVSQDDSGGLMLDIKNPRPKNTDILLAQLWERLTGI